MTQSKKFTFNPRDLRIRFHELARDIKAIEDATRPLREERDFLVHQNQARIRELEAQYLAAEGPLFDMKNEQAAIARALGGKTGKDPLEVEKEIAVSTSGDDDEALPN
jgi:hypothetical protein